MFVPAVFKMLRELISVLTESQAYVFTGIKMVSVHDHKTLPGEKM